ncbi:MAG: hypothetical protein NZX77_16180 [Polyangiaceae bacterium]|nr:hypothetical protein [Polyangiaceae bacterium]
MVQDEERSSPACKRSPKTTVSKASQPRTALGSSRGLGASSKAEAPRPSTRPRLSSSRSLTPPPALAPTVEVSEDPQLGARFEQVLGQISLRIKQGNYVAEQCTMLVEIARISASASCPTALRNRAMELLLTLSRRPEHERPCRRGVREMLEQCLARGILR